MPDIPLPSQALDIAFHPKNDFIFTALLNGKILCYSYDETGSVELTWKARPSKKSARAIDTDPTGDILWSGFKSGALCSIDTGTSKIVREWEKAHEAPISRISALAENMHMFASGDDDGAIKLWDTRLSSQNMEAMRVYTHHTDYITDFVWLSDKKHLVATSGDGTLSVLDVRSNKSKPFAQSEDQEDELLSAIPLKGGKKLAVGTQLGPLLIFDRSKGYLDCVDRFIGHPQSVDAIVSLSSSHITSDVIATGSSDGLIRVVQIHPSKFLGVIAEHGSSAAGEKDDSGEGLPVERMCLDRKGKWLGSISHDELLKLTDVEGALEGSDSDEDSEKEEEEEDDDDDKKSVEGVSEGIEQEDDEESATHKEEAGTQDEESDSEKSDKSASPPAIANSRLSKKRKRKQLKQEEAKKRKKGSGPPNSFFADL